jgi:dTDP-4-amino-4,6-dideoxygalactose transaminase
MIPFMDLDAQYKMIQEEMDDAIFRVIRSYKFINGPDVAQFERDFAVAHDVKHCIGCSSGTSALHLAYEAIGLEAGDEVIVPTMTFIATVEPLRQVGAVPVFVDSNKVSYNIDPDKIEVAITEKTKAIVVVHLHGNPCEMDKIMKIANQYNLKVVEDCAQAHLAEYNGQKIGTFGDVATFSFYPGKNLGAYGDAGAVITNSTEYCQKIRQLVNHGRKEKYFHDIEGYNYRMDTLQAAILNVKLKYLESWTKQRIELAKSYINELQDCEIVLPMAVENGRHVFHVFAMLVKNREEIINKLKSNHIAYGIHYPVPLHMQPAYKHLGYQEGEFPVAEELASKFLSLPLYAELPEFQVKRISEIVRSGLVNE